VGHVLGFWSFDDGGLEGLKVWDVTVICGFGAESVTSQDPSVQLT
jgi:hypothetical protein